VPRIEYVREKVEMIEVPDLIGNESSAEPVFIEPRFNFVEEDPSRPSIFWKLHEYYCVIVNCERVVPPPKLSEISTLFDEERLEKYTKDKTFNHIV